MSGVAAILDLRGGQADAAELELLLAVLERRGPDGRSLQSVGPVVLGCARLDTLPEDGPQPVTFANVTAVADARLDNRGELEQSLGLPDSLSDAEVVAASLNRWGRRAVERLEGDFAFLAWNGRELLAGRDRFGIRPLHYSQAADRLILASEVDAITAHPRIAATPDRDYFIAHLTANMPSTRRTPFRGIRRLMPGETLFARPATRIRREIYYSLPSRTLTSSLEEAALRTRDLLEDAVRVRLRSRGPVASDLSGGLDSTSIYATARRLGAPVHARSLVSDKWPVMDERDYSRNLVGTDPWSWIFLEEHPPMRDALQHARLFDEPSQDILFSAPRLALEAARPTECRVILSGHGGDGTMTGGYGAVQALVRRGRLLAAYREARAWADERDLPLFRFMAMALRPAYSPKRRYPWGTLPRRIEAHMAARAAARHLQRASRGRVDVALFLNSTQRGLRQRPSVASETRYPFLHRPLVEYALATPPALKAAAGVGKLVLRRAMCDRLPQAILGRRDKTGFDPAYAQGLADHWPLVETWLRSPCLADLGILEPAGLRAMCDEVRRGRGARLMEVVHALAVETWLRANLTAGSERHAVGTMRSHRWRPAGRDVPQQREIGRR